MTAPTTGTALNTSELRAMLAAATPGPWRTFPDAEGGVWARDGYGMAATGCGQKNGDLIAAAVNNLEALLDAADERDALRAAVEALADEWEHEADTQAQWRGRGYAERLRAALAGPNPRGGQDGGGE